MAHHSVVWYRPCTDPLRPVIATYSITVSQPSSSGHLAEPSAVWIRNPSAATSTVKTSPWTRVSTPGRHQSPVDHIGLRLHAAGQQLDQLRYVDVTNYSISHRFSYKWTLPINQRDDCTRRYTPDSSWHRTEPVVNVVTPPAENIQQEYKNVSQCYYYHSLNYYCVTVLLLLRLMCI